MGTVYHKNVSGDDLHQPFKIGNDVNKSGSPITGDWYFATDTNVLYRCATAGVWESRKIDDSSTGANDLWSAQKIWSEITTISGQLDEHNELKNIQGGAAADYYHLTSAQHTDLTDSGDCSIHKHDDIYYTETEVDTISGALQSQISAENLWDRTGTTLVTHTPGDDIAFGAGTVTGTGDIYCGDLYTDGSTVYIGDSVISSEGTGAVLLLKDKAIKTESLYLSASSKPSVRFETQVAGLTDIGPNNGSSFINDSSIGGTTWSNTTNAQVRDDSTSDAFGSGVTKYLKATGFNFNIPSTYSIVGIIVEVAVIDKFGGGSFMDNAVKIVKGGVISGDDKSDLINPWPATYTYRTYGASDDLWGLLWTPADINSSDFGFAISGNAGSMCVTGVDHICITVYYLEAPKNWIFGTYKDGTNNNFKFSKSDTLGVDDILKITNFGIEVIGDTYTTDNSVVAGGDIQVLNGGIYIGDDTELKRGNLKLDSYNIQNNDSKFIIGKTVIEQNDFITKSDFGNTWTAKESNQNWIGVAMSADGMKQTSTIGNGQIYVSIDSGNTWTAKDSTRNWRRVAMSSDGTKQTATAYGNYIYVSIDSGNTWTAKDSSRVWLGVAMSSDGTKQTATAYGNYIYVSIDSGNTWTAKESTRDWHNVAMSSDGTKQTAVVFGGQIYVSIDSGNTWTAKESNRDWIGVAMSADGTKQTTVVFGGQIYVSIDSGNTWTAKESNRDWHNVAMSSDGTKQTAVVRAGQIYVSIDSGNTWTAKESNRDWIGVAMSADGTKQTVTEQGGRIYVSYADININSNLDIGSNLTISGTVDGVDIATFKSDFDNHLHDDRYYTETEIDTELGNYLNKDGSVQLTGEWDFGAQTISGTGDIYCNTLVADDFRINNTHTPATSSGTGNKGDICWDTDYVYVCVDTDTWKRTSLSTW